MTPEESALQLTTQSNRLNLEPKLPHADFVCLDQLCAVLLSLFDDAERMKSGYIKLCK